MLFIIAGNSQANAIPSITTQPTNQAAKLSGTATFSVVASGTAPLAYQWYSNQYGVISGATSSNYSLTATNDQCFYVKVSNLYGSVQSNYACLYIVSPPVIGNQPISTTVTEPGIAYFEVDAYDSDGGNDLTYQWYRNSVAIAGATEYIYTKAETTTADNGASFYATVKNAAGSVTSSAATLTVNAPTAGTLPITGAWSGTATATYPPGGDGPAGDGSGTVTYQVVATFSQTSYSLTGTFVSTDNYGVPSFGAGIASLNGQNLYTVGGEDGVSIAAGFTTNQLTLNGIAVSSDGSGGSGQLNISTDHTTLTGNATISGVTNTKITWTLTREK
jgi:hypothetical protein